jgi:hypothetical protein
VDMHNTYIKPNCVACCRGGALGVVGRYVTYVPELHSLTIQFFVQLISAIFGAFFHRL